MPYAFPYTYLSPPAPLTDYRSGGCGCFGCENETQRREDVRSGAGPAFEAALEAFFMAGECRCSNCRSYVVARVIDAAGVGDAPAADAPAADAPAHADAPAADAPAADAADLLVDEDEEDEEPRCYCCGEQAECDCHACRNCGDRFRSSEACDRRDCGGCPDCCPHVTCDSCDVRRHGDSICSECSTCDSCCSCWYCEGCEETHAEGVRQCPDCSCCTDRCDCASASREDSEGENSSPSGRGRPRFVRLGAEPTFHKGETFKRNPSRRFISVEIEVARSAEDTSRHVDPVVSRWEGTAVVEDGSLPDSGYEINTAPTSGDAFIERIEELSAALGRADAIVTTACGMHVHVDARDLSYRALQRAVALYARVEPALFDMVPASRKNNRYCQRCGPEFLQRGIAASLERASGKSPKQAKGVLVQAVYGENVDDVYGKERFESRSKYKYDDARYAALNLHSWFYRGTVEVRLAAGTTNAKKITCWAMIVASLLDWAKAHRDADVAALPENALEALLSVIPTEEVREWARERHGMFRRA